jgi:formylglycine-generating enzyme required for sulfatase activity
VTVRQFRQFVAATGYRTAAERRGWAFAYEQGQARRVPGRSWRDPGFDQGDAHPVTCVTWYDASEFCRWLRAQDGRTYRLPTEAEWEYAGRAGTTTVYWWGDDPDTTGRVANVADRGHLGPGPGYAVMPMDDGYRHTAPVACYQANGLGLYDMIGNVCEWCADEYAAYPQHGRGGHDDAAGTRGRCVLRGGSWYNVTYYCRMAYRFSLPADEAYSNTGFRVAVSAD